MLHKPCYLLQQKSEEQFEAAPINIHGDKISSNIILSPSSSSCATSSLTQTHTFTANQLTMSKRKVART